MRDAILTHEPLIRMGLFGAVFAAMALWEAVAPRRALSIGRLLRWPNNLGVFALNVALVRLLFPAAAVGFAVFAGEVGWGLFNAADWPVWAETVAAVLLLDLAIYLQHRMFHAVPILWRLHRMHHADLDFDVTTALRFHPVEIYLSMGIKFAVIVGLGAPLLAVLVFEAALNSGAMFNHGNVRMPRWLDRVLRSVLVTPDMHRVHHSVIPMETDSNFGFNLSWWDRLFGTYRPQPEAGHEAMVIGIRTFRSPRDLMLHNMLLQPLLGNGNAPRG